MKHKGIITTARVEHPHVFSPGDVVQTEDPIIAPPGWATPFTATSKFSPGNAVWHMHNNVCKCSIVQAVRIESFKPNANCEASTNINYDVLVVNDPCHVHSPEKAQWGRTEMEVINERFLFAGKEELLNSYR